MLRKKRPDPHAARKLLGRFWWEVQAVLPPEEEQASHLAMQRLDSYERLLLETVGSLPMKPPALVTEGESAVEELIEGLLSDLSKPVSLDEAARRIGFSRAHFCRLFRQATGQSYNSFMTGKRIEQACVLLRAAQGAAARGRGRRGVQRRALLPQALFSAHAHERRRVGSRSGRRER